MKRSVSSFVLASFLIVLTTLPLLGAPLTGSGTLPFPGATGDPPRDAYQSAGPAGGPYTGTWPARVRTVRRSRRGGARFP